jgi:hypothetical protein
MSISTYNDLISAITSWTHRSDISGQSADFVTLGESRIYSDLRVRAMESTMATVIASGVIAVPSTYLELKKAYISSTSPYGPLTRKSVDWIYEKYPTRSSTDTPLFIAREGGNFIFGPYPDSAYTVTLHHWARPSALSSAVNTIFTNYPGLYLYSALCEAAPFMKDQKMLSVWELKYREILGRCQSDNDKEGWSGSGLSMTPAGITP